MTQGPLVDIRNLRVMFDTPGGRRTVVNDVSLQLMPGEVLGVLGESGSGKTMTTMALLGLIDGYPGVVDGQIIISNGAKRIDLLETPLKSVRRAGDSFEKDLKLWSRWSKATMQNFWGGFVTAIFQHPRASLDPLETIGQQVDESVRLAHPNLSREEARGKTIRWLEEVQLSNPARVANSYPHELSGGMCQRAMIAVAIAREPRILIADEPTTGLDSTVRAEIVELFRTLLEKHGGSMMYISHDIREVLYLSDRVIVMRHGEIVETVSAEHLHAGEGNRHEYTQVLMSASEIAFSE